LGFKIKMSVGNWVKVGPTCEIVIITLTSLALNWCLGISLTQNHEQFGIAMANGTKWQRRWRIGEGMRGIPLRAFLRKMAYLGSLLKFFTETTNFLSRSRNLRI